MRAMILTVLTCTWSLTLPAKAQCVQTNPPVEGQGIVTVGLDDNGLAVASGTFNVSPAYTDAALAFADALQTMPSGGELRVLPGTYDFQQPVQIAASGITIRGSKGAVLTASHGLGTLFFVVDADDFVLADLEIVADPSRATSGQAAVLLQGERATVRDCRFILADGAQNQFAALKIAPTGIGSLQGAQVRACSFAFPTVVSDSIGIAIDSVDGLRILANVFGGGGAPQHCGGALDLVDSRSVAVAQNGFRDLAGAAGDVLVRGDNLNSLCFSGNTIDRCQFDQLVRLDGALLDGTPATVAGNVLDSGGTSGVVGVRTDLRGIVMAGNTLRGLAPAVLLDGANGVLVTDNIFASCGAVQLQSTAQPAEDVHVNANSLHASPGLPPNTTAIDFSTGGSGHMMYGNTAFGSWDCEPWAIQTTGSSRLQCGENWSPDCGEPGFVTCLGSGCPCANDPPEGLDEGCLNSLGMGARICGSGSSSLVADDLSLTVSQCPPEAFGLFLIAGALLTTPNNTAFDGLLCLNGPLRLQSAKVSQEGLASETGFWNAANSVSPDFVQAGSVYYLQFWYRDPAGPCPTSGNSNLSPVYGVDVTP